MSTSTAARPLPRRAVVERPRLTVVEAPLRRPSGLGFVGLCLGIVLAAMITMLVVNTARGENSFRAGELRATQAELAARESALRAELATRDDPDWIAQRAQGLGMLPGGSPAYVDGSTGEITGVATLPDARAVFTVLTGRFADRVPPIVKNDARPGIPGLLTLALPGSAPSVLAPPAGASAAEVPSTPTPTATPTATAPATPKPPATATTTPSTAKPSVPTQPTAPGTAGTASTPKAAATTTAPTKPKTTTTKG